MFFDFNKNFKFFPKNNIKDLYKTEILLNLKKILKNLKNSKRKTQFTLFKE